MTQRQAIESMYIDKCDIIHMVSAQNPINKRMELTEQTVATDIPCKLSVNTVLGASESGTGSTATQVTKVFLAPELDIPAGSKFLIRHYGREFKYESSGYPALYSCHQEVTLVRSDWT